MGGLPPPPPTFNPNRDKENVSGQILGITTTFHAIALLFVLLHWFIVASALAALLGGTVPMFLQAQHGLGRHLDTLSTEDMVIFNQLGFIQSIVLSIAGIAFLKIGIALELLKLKGKGWAWYSISLWVMIGFVIAYAIMGWASLFFYCSPLPKFWDNSIHGTCYSIQLFVKFGIVNTALNIFTDIVFATLPVPIVWTLQMPLKTRIYLIVILSLGYLAVAMGMAKGVAQITFDVYSDHTYKYDIQFWGTLQLNLGIIAACAPPLKPLFRNVLKLGSDINARYGSRDRTGQSTNLSAIGGKDLTVQRSRAIDTADDFELGAPDPTHLRSNTSMSSYRATVRGGENIASSGPYQSWFEDDTNDRTGSQDSILPRYTRNAILRTTEVSVTH